MRRFSFVAIFKSFPKYLVHVDFPIYCRLNSSSVHKLVILCINWLHLCFLGLCNFSRPKKAPSKDWSLTLLVNFFKQSHLLVGFSNVLFWVFWKEKSMVYIVKTVFATYTIALIDDSHWFLLPKHSKQNIWESNYTTV